jgi:monoterpene epsilon-lactone hydrolase
MASEQFQAVVGALRANAPDLQGEDVHVLRASMESWVPDRLPEGVDIEVVAANGVPAEFVRAPNARADAALLYLHGGGYCIGSIRTHRGLAAQLSRTTSLPVLLIDYRLAPEHPHPAAVDDATSAYRFLLDAGVAPEKVAIAGDSAGGGLTIATLLAIRDRGLPLPAAGVAISPWTDMGCESESYTTRADVDPMVTRVGLKQMADWFLNGQDARDPLASPLHADLAGLPPLLVHVGDHEVLLDDGVGVAQRAKDAGVDVTVEVWPEMIHVWHAFVGVVPESQEAIDKIDVFLAANVAR